MHNIKPLSYSMMLTCAPDSQQANNALNFIEGLVKTPHSIKFIFFYSEGIWHALPKLATGKTNPYLTLWYNLAKQYQLTYAVCQTGLKYRNISLDAIKPPFQLSGLHEFLQKSLSNDRFIQFK